MIGFLIGLPLRIAFGAFSLFLTVITLPLRILIRNPWLLAILVIGTLFYAWVAGGKGGAPKQITPATESGAPYRSSYQQNYQRNGAPRIDPVLKQENGNSAFAADLYAQMSDQEKYYYSQIFFHVMANQKSNKLYPWSYLNISGEIQPVDSFINKRGQVCRRFTETLKVHTTQQNLSGISCQSGGGKWCKLQSNATPACNLGYNPGFIDSIRDGFGKMF